MRHLQFLLFVVGLAGLAGCSSIDRTEPAAAPQTQPQLPGIQADGAVRLPNQWFLRPVGKQIVVGDFPVNVALHPGGKFAAVLHCGNGPHEIVVLELSGGRLVSRATTEESFYGIAFTKDGSKLFCSGAGLELVHEFAFKDGYLSAHEEIRLRDVKERGIPSGLACSADGRTLYVANVWSHSVSVVDLAKRTVAELLLGTNTVSAPRDLPPPTTDDEASISKRAEALLDQTKPEDPFPYACVLDERRRRLYVSLWAQSSIAVIDTATLQVLDRWRVEEHPNEMLLSRSGKHLFVANANRNSVSILDTGPGQSVETLIAELKPNSPPGSTPNSLALSPDEKTLFVANANINTIADFDVATQGKSRSLGFIPVGWYPTSVRVTPDGRRLLVANGKGLISKPNRHGPQPGGDGPATVREYIASLMDGTVSIIDLPSGEKFTEQMRRHTAQAYRCLPTPRPEATADGANNPIPSVIGGPSPIKYCLYIIKENRTYDQVLGDLPQGNGDPSL
jgi:DNA-binding beta-propeller fold protein YncE